MCHPPICPRCRHYIPNDLHAGARRGPVSRDSEAEICTACRCHEDMLSTIGRDVPASWQWPIATRWDVTTPLSHLRVLQHLGIRVSGVAASSRELRSQEAEARRKLGLPSASTVPTEMSDSGRLLNALRGLETTGVVWGWAQCDGDREKGRGWWSDGAHISGASAVAPAQELVWFNREELSFDERGRLREGRHHWLCISVSDEKTVAAASDSAASHLLALARSVELVLQYHGLSAVPRLGGSRVYLMGQLLRP